jgi:hypothetical protein
MEDVITAKADYSKLDQAENAVRIRLGSTALNAQQNHAAGTAPSVSVAYARDGNLHRVKAKHCVLACYHAMVPFLCPELPEEQKKALHYCVKAPFVYTHVAIRNWEAFQKLGIHQIMAPGGYHSFIALDFPVSVGEYKFPSKPEEPAVLFMLRTPCSPGAPRRDQYRAGRFELLNTTFETIERNVREQLQRMLGGTGFDAARDIEAITVNRCAHGYEYEHHRHSAVMPRAASEMSLGRRRWKYAIANSDGAGDRMSLSRAGSAENLATLINRAGRSGKKFLAGDGRGAAVPARELPQIADVTVIGGGYAGLAAARTRGAGAGCSTGGRKCWVGRELQRRHGIGLKLGINADSGRGYVALYARRESIDGVEALVREENIDCDFRVAGIWKSRANRGTMKNFELLRK